jgi:hypothetical protein
MRHNRHGCVSPLITSSVQNRIGDSQLTIEFLDCYKPLEIERRSFASINKDQIALRKDLKRSASSSSPWNTLQTTQTNVKLADWKDTTTVGFWEAQV